MVPSSRAVAATTARSACRAALVCPLHRAMGRGPGRYLLRCVDEGYPRSIREVVFAAKPRRPMLVAVAPPQTSSRG